MSPLGGQVRIPKTAEVVATRIRKAIIRGDMEAGFKLPAEAVMMADFEVSRPTLREAFRVLESEGLITVARGARGGARVNRVSGDMLTRATGLALQAHGATLRDLFEARSIVEPPAAGMIAAARNLTAAAALRACLEREKAAVKDDQPPTELIAEFHRLVLEGSGNVALALVGRALHDVVASHLRYAALSKPAMAPAAAAKRIRLGLKSQARLIDLIEAGDAVEAEAHWRRHMRASGDVWLAGVAGAAVIDALDDLG